MTPDDEYDVGDGVRHFLMMNTDAPTSETPPIVDRMMVVGEVSVGVE